ncbi:MAG TPA: type II toxin-antitoxin system VapC family toxin [Thermodesulfovibrionales bacterium]|nr:type II toxin-antitoxin system VapC family toxin [Thermodesulfovibrionales bacterium]
MKNLILDSHALLTYFEDERGAEKVQSLLEQAEKGKVAIFMSIVNWGEVYYSLRRTKGAERAEESLLVIEQLPISFVEVDKDVMYKVAQLKAHHPIALGDCFAAALAVEHRCPVMTGDREFEKLGKLVTVEWL